MAGKALRPSAPSATLRFAFREGGNCHPHMTDVIFRRRRSVDRWTVRFLRVLPLVLSALLLAAHFYRSGLIVLVFIAVALPLVLLLRFDWVVPAVQVALFVAAAEWVRTAVAIAGAREAMGAPTARMFAILLTVAAFTALSAVPLRKS